MDISSAVKANMENMREFDVLSVSLFNVMSSNYVRQTNEQTNERTDGRSDGWMDGWSGGFVLFLVLVCT